MRKEIKLAHYGMVVIGNLNFLSLAKQIDAVLG